MGVAVPALVKLWIAKAEVAPDVDNRATIVEPSACLLRPLAGGKSREHDLGVPDVRANDERVLGRMQVGLNGAERLGLMRAGHGRREPRLRAPWPETRP